LTELHLSNNNLDTKAKDALRASKYASLELEL